MMKQAVFLCLAFFAFIPASLAAKKDEKPAWLNNPYAVCTQDEICAVGIGSGLNTAKADARSGIAKVFEAKIQSSFESTLSQDDQETTSKIRDYVSESSDVLLQAVDIRETYDTPENIYALAVLNKPAAARMTKEEIDDLDQKMEALLKEDTPAAAVRLEKLYEQRRGLNQRYIVLTGKPVMESVSYDQVYANKKARIGKRHIFLKTQGSANKAFDQAVRSVMKDNGYTFASAPSGTVPSVVISMTGEEQYSNISGFVKYAYHFTMKGPDKRGNTVDVLAATFEESGRTEQQAYKNALDSLKAYLSENILNLNF